jgi:hypothetical protein
MQWRDRVQITVCMNPVLVESVIVILWQKSVHGKGYYTGNVRYHRKNPIVLMFLPNNPAGNKFR